MDRPQAGSLAPIQHPPGADFVAVLEITDAAPEPARRSLAGRVVEGMTVIAIIGILVALMLPAVQSPRSGGATHSARSEREARRLEIERAMAEQEEYLRNTSVEGITATPDGLSHSE